MAKLEASILTASMSLVIVSLLLMTHVIVLPRQGPLEDTLNLTSRLASRIHPAYAVASATSLFLTATELLRTLEPWLTLFCFLTILILEWRPRFRRWWSALSGQAMNIAMPSRTFPTMR